MTLKGRYALYCRKDACFGAHHKNLNEDRPILSQQKCSPITLVSGDIGVMRIFAEVPWGGGVQSVVSFSVIPKCVTLSDLEWLFRVKFCSRAGLAGFDRATF